MKLSVHHRFRALKTFLSSCVEADVLSENPVGGTTIKSCGPCHVFPRTKGSPTEGVQEPMVETAEERINA